MPRARGIRAVGTEGGKKLIEGRDAAGGILLRRRSREIGVGRRDAAAARTCGYVEVGNKS